jgi:ATP-dependent Clp protease protease subunit
VRADLEAALAADTGRDVTTLRHDTDRDLILPAADAVAYGLADHVLTAPAPAPARASAGAFATAR